MSDCPHDVAEIEAAAVVKFAMWVLPSEYAIRAREWADDLRNGRA